MSRSLICGFRRMAALGVAACLCLTGSAFALIPPPFYYPPVVVQGDPVPDPPTPVPPVVDVPPPPCSCDCDGPHIANTPEPTTMISALLGASALGGYALRRRGKKTPAV